MMSPTAYPESAGMPWAGDVDGFSALVLSLTEPLLQDSMIAGYRNHFIIMRRRHPERWARATGTFLWAMAREIASPPLIVLTPDDGGEWGAYVKLTVASTGAGEWFRYGGSREDFGDMDDSDVSLPAALTVGQACLVAAPQLGLFQAMHACSELARPRDFVAAAKVLAWIARSQGKLDADKLLLAAEVSCQWENSLEETIELLGGDVSRELQEEHEE